MGSDIKTVDNSEYFGQIVVNPDGTTIGAGGSPLTAKTFSTAAAPATSEFALVDANRRIEISQLEGVTPVVRGDGVTCLPVDTEISVDNATLNINNLFVASNDGAVTGAGYMSMDANGYLNTNVKSSGLSSVDIDYTDVSSTNITTAAYVELITATSGDVSYIDIYNTTGEYIYLATGAAASETDQLIIPPLGMEVNLAISSGTRVSAKAVAVNATAGELVLNLLG